MCIVRYVIQHNDFDGSCTVYDTPYNHVEFCSITEIFILLFRCKNLLGRCVIVSEVSSDVFSRISLLFSLPFTELDRKEVNNGLQTIM